MRKTKKILALLLSVLLMLTTFSTTGFAYVYNDGVLIAGTNDFTVPTLSLELFDSTFTKTTIDAVKADPSATFYLAIKATNFDRFTGMLDDGITNLYIPVNFNTDVFAIGEPTIRGSNKLTDTSLKTRITDYAKNTGKTITYTGDPTVYACSLLDAPRETTKNPYPGTYKVTPTEINVNIDVDGDGEVDKRMYQYQLKFSPEGDNPTAAGGMYNEEYVGFIAIKLKSGVSYDDIEDGTASFEFGTRQQDGMAVKIGQTGSNLAYNGADSSLQNYLRLDTSEADFFPTQYYVDFYEDEDPGTAVSKTIDTAMSNDPYLDQSDIDSVTENDITSPNEDGKYVTRWYYKHEMLVKGDDGTNSTVVVNEDFTGNTYDNGGELLTMGTDLTNLVEAASDGKMRAKVYAEWEPGTAVTFEKNYPSDYTATDASPIVLYAHPTTGIIPSSELDRLDDIEIPDGYALAGWAESPTATTPTFTTADLATSTFNTAITLNAVWQKNVKVTFDLNYAGAAAPTVVEITPGASVAADKVPATTGRTDYTFSEWNTQSNGGGDTIDPTTDTFDTNTTLYAIWTASGSETVTLSFDAVLAGVTLDVTSVTVNKGDTVYDNAIPTTPSKTDYTFDGWFKSAAVTDTDEIDFETDGLVVNENMTVYAHWTYTGANAVTITFSENYTGGNDTYATATVAPNSTLGDAMPANPTRDDYSFNGWNTQADGTGTVFDKNTSVGTTSPVTVYAQWKDNITVKYNLNGGTATPAIEDAVGAPDDEFTLTTTVPTRTYNGKDYEFIGWNSAQNGSGKYVEADNAGTAWTFESLQTYVGETSSEITLYAYWAAVDPDDKEGGEGDDPPVDPADDGIRIKFDSNAGDDTSVVNAKPMYKYLYDGDSMQPGDFPAVPTRAKYVFKSWNTAANGSGTTIDTTSAYVVSSANATDDQIILYAQWDVNTDIPGVDEITITFNVNHTDGTGAGYNNPNPATMTLAAGDALVNLPNNPSRVGYEFKGWNMAADGSGTAVVAGSPTFAANTTVYAQWEKELRFDVGYTHDSSWDNETVYDGNAQAPTHIEIYDITSAGGVDYSGTDAAYNVTSNYAGKYTIKYTYTDSDGVEQTLTTAPTEAGTYIVNIEFDSSVTDAKAAKVNPGTIIINPAGLTLDVDKHEAKVSSSTAYVAASDLPTYTVTKADGSNHTDYDVKYFKWTDANDNGAIDSGEVAETATASNELTSGYYVVAVESTDSNYKISQVTTTTTVYPTAGPSNLPVYADGTIGKDIVFHVILDDPVATSLRVTKNDTGRTDYDLKDDDYTTPKPFASKQTEGDNPTDDYYVRAEVGTEDVVILVGAEDAYNVTVKLGDTTITPNKDGEYVVTGLEGAVKGSTNDITVTVSNDDGSSSIIYTIHVQVLVKSSIELAPGNSPFGAIMADNSITDKDTAKAKFIENVNKFDAAYLPAGYSVNMTYTPEAWVGPYDKDKTTKLPLDPDIAAKIADPKINLDRDETVIFAYERTEFVDPGFSVKDSLGKDVAAADVTRTISGIYRLDNFKINTDISEQIPEEITIPGTSNDLSAIVADLSESGVKGALVRPGVYELKYSYYDKQLGETVTIEQVRKIVVIPNIGDADMQDGVTTSDPVDIYAHAKNIKKIIDTTIAGDIENLFLYRVCDTDMQDGVTTSDPVDIYAHAKNIKYMTEFYQVTK